MPMCAVPPSFITDESALKLTLMSPGFTMISDIPTTPWRRMSSATRNASAMGVLSGTICSRRSLLMTTRVSTSSASRAMASLACFMRFRPSKANGLVTTPIVRAPIFLACCATTGAAPEPVPPPMPAVTKTRSLPRIAFLISGMLSCAACWPTSGSPPQPRPRVILSPRARILLQLLDRRTCWSVFKDQNLTRLVEAALTPTMRLIALPPPPPTPTTLMLHFSAISSSTFSSSSGSCSLIGGGGYSDRVPGSAASSLEINGGSWLLVGKGSSGGSP
mmetsp:Transcript_7248/g.20904  ORF Transcript_7248/g.20904 Transcript_7248/m.20904 type:complete len:276 (-) Transcript_7248:718-1545(-)